MAKTRDPQISDFEVAATQIIGSVAGQTAALLCLFMAVSENTANAYGPLCLLVICVLGAYRLIQKEMALVWSPMMWFLLAYSVYYGIGPLLYIYGTPQAVARVNSYYFADEHALYRSNLLNVAALLTVCAAYLAMQHL